MDTTPELGRTLEGQEGALWQRWQHERDPKTRDALILHYSPWARAVARDVYVRVYLIRDAWHDCAQNALLGLIEAIERFDPRRGVPFKPYARHRVRGAVFDGVRALRTGTLLADNHVSDVRVTERLESLQEDASTDPLEAFIAITVGLGLGFLLDMQSMPDQSRPAEGYAELERAELNAAVAEEMERLPERERLILQLHYYHQIQFVDIAGQMSLTKGRISQLHKRALERLRVGLRERILLEC